MKPNAIWRLPAVGVVNLSNTGNRREPLFASGFRHLVILICEGVQRHQANIDELRSIGPRLLSEGWTLSTWHSTTGITSPVAEATAAWNAMRDHKGMISGHVLNGEDWYEGNNAWKTRPYLENFRELSGGMPMASWPMGSDAPEYPRAFDYAACIEMGCMIYPQQYANVYPSLTIPNGDANLNKAGVPVENRGTSPGCYIGAGASSIPWDTYAADLKTLKSRPVLLYAGDLAGFDPVQAAKLVIPDAPPEPTEPEDDDMQKIGIGNPPQDGITAMYNRMRDMDPGGTLLVKGADGKWPSIDTLAETPLGKWKAYDKAERSQRILVEDHDAMMET